MKIVQQIFDIPGLEETFINNFKAVLVLKFEDSPNYAGIRQCLSYCFKQCFESGENKSIHTLDEPGSSPCSNNSKLMTHRFEWMMTFADKKKQRDMKKDAEGRIFEGHCIDFR